MPTDRDAERILNTPARDCECVVADEPAPCACGWGERSGADAVILRPGWLMRDVVKAQARIAEWKGGGK